MQGKEIIFSQEDLEEFATGKIANVFGPEYALIDTYRRRVMLPMHPYLLVSRVTGRKGKLGEYKPSTMQTEYDIPYNAWFTTDGQIPWAVSVESGQCDLLLISYLGIDFQNKGNLVYRLLEVRAWPRSACAIGRWHATEGGNLPSAAWWSSCVTCRPRSWPP